MNGAREYCKLFKKATQIGRLYLLPHYHARGATFRIFVLPKGEKVIENAGINPPLNKGGVEVYGVVSGNPGWTESYGWLHEGKWQDDFEKIVKERSDIAKNDKADLEIMLDNRKEEKEQRVKDFLAGY